MGYMYKYVYGIWTSDKRCVLRTRPKIFRKCRTGIRIIPCHCAEQFFMIQSCLTLQIHSLNTIASFIICILKSAIFMYNTDQTI